ncbi:NUDIX hydrolase [Moraxella sp. ZY210820]|uniref:NUDIX hydrolase n=1 Tax=unclassified Moraxella TaxID=2685852 RepID=UPI0027317875|nr:NUDIX hydrolase [Moraxella sp. ZY210820]WLF83209.1 NUDIX hydrolase [Moraxella sp. ZY210820]
MWLAHVTVAIVVEQNNRFLMVEEYAKERGSQVFNQPAGHIEAGESLIQACVRETLEETAWHVQITDLLGIYTYTPPNTFDRTYYRFCFIGQVIEQSQNALDPDITAVHWLTADEIEQSGQARSPLVMQCIRDYQSGQKLPLSIINEQFLIPQPLLQQV